MATGRRMTIPTIRFRLKSCLAVCLLLSVWLGFWCSAARHQRLAVRALCRNHRAMVRYDFDGSTNMLGGAEMSPLPAWLVDVVGVDMFHRVKLVSVLNFHFRDEDLPQVTRLRDLRFLFLSHTDISDDGLVVIPKLTELEGLSLENTRIGDRSIPHLRRLRQLRWLDVSGTKISDAGMEMLKSDLPHCRIVHE